MEVKCRKSVAQIGIEENFWYFINLNCFLSEESPLQANVLQILRLLHDFQPSAAAQAALPASSFVPTCRVLRAISTLNLL